MSEDGKSLKGYLSARRAPNNDALPTIKKLYKTMLAEESKQPGKAGIESSVAYLNNYCEQQGLNYDQMVVQIQSK